MGIFSQRFNSFLKKLKIKKIRDIKKKEIYHEMYFYE